MIEILGRPGDFGVDVEILIRKHHLPHEFSAEVLAEAAAAAHPVGDAERAGRRDFRDLPIVTIDGETARDFDDAVYVRRLENGHWQLQVHIADVSHYVRRGSALDREARLRGTSVYFPNRAVPMLPEELSNGICSLNPREDRLVMSAVMELDASGEIVASEFARGVIRSAERMTYTAVNAVLQGDAIATSEYAHLAEHFRAMRDLAVILNARRARLGSIDFDLPEPVIEFDANGQMTGIVRSERNIAHRLIEEFMLTANQAVARYLEGRGIGSLHRVHEKPDPKKILEFEEMAHTFGYSLGVENLAERRVAVRHGSARSQRFDRGARHGRAGRGRERPMTVSLPGALDIAIRPEHYQRLAEKIAGKPEERIVSYLMLRSLKQARYAADPLGHFALAFDQYTHFTSPIRRYPDLIVHRVLKWALDHPESKPVRLCGQHEGRATRSGAEKRRVHIRPVSPRRTRSHRRGNFRDRAPRRNRRARIDGLEDGAVHGAASGRGVRRADYFRAEIRILRRADGNFRRGPRAHQSHRGADRRARLLPRARSRHRQRQRKLERPEPPRRRAEGSAGKSTRKNPAAEPRKASTSGNSATASASAPNASIPSAAASSFRRCLKNTSRTGFSLSGLH